MADYLSDIVVSDYLYKRAITITEKSGLDHSNVHLRLQLNSSNFNFDFARSDGLDFRLAEGSGTKVLKMFIGYWNATLKQATIYFKLPLLEASEIKTLYAFWGNSSDVGISDIHSVDFHFSDHFDDAATYNNNWSESAGGTIIVNKYFGGDTEGHTTVCLTMGNNLEGYIQSKTDPIPPLSSWAAEMGYWMYEDTFINDTWKYSHIISFWGSGINEVRNYFAADGVPGAMTEDVQYGQYGPRAENFADGSASYPGGYWAYLWGALVLDSYHQNFFGYHLTDDSFHYGMYNRNLNRISSSCPSAWAGNYLENKERKIEGNSDFTRVRLWGARRGGYAELAGTEVYFDWVLVRNFLGAYEPEWDLSNLYVEYEQVNPDVLVYDYGADITAITFDHTTTSGGTPLYLSDDSLLDVWCSDDVAASGSVDLAIDFGAYGTNLVDDAYLHYDSDHVLHLNAACLSDRDVDLYNNTYWNGTTTSGWAVIDFDGRINNVGIVRVKGIASKLFGMVKNYKIEGSYVYTDNWEDDHWKVLDEGQFGQTDSWQSTLFINYNNYRFYRLKVIDTYGGNIALQEWKMYKYDDSLGKRVVSRLKLKPDATDSNFIYFPKQIEFYGSNDAYNWTTLISTKKTYTPVAGAWQEYAFSNIIPYYIYMLRCIGNWNNNTGKICIAEWSMHERNVEASYHRILAGTSNNYIAIWGDPGSTFDELEFYVVNDKISFVENEKLVGTKTFTGSPTDLYVV